MKRILKEYLTFSKKERTAVIILLLLITFFIAAPYFYAAKPKPPVISKAMLGFLSANQKAMDSSGETIVSYHEEPAKETPHFENFVFDPNTISESGWKRLGLTDKTIHTIINYRSKGGKFRSPEDLRKIWGIKKQDAERLIPFAHIETDALVKAPARFHDSLAKPSYNTVFSKPPATAIDINTATADQWKSLPGIGEILAARITRYREKINGFTAISQVAKTYGVSDSLFQVISPYLLVKTETLPKLDINKASAYDLQKKTGIAIDIAKAIVLYRQQNGSYPSVDGLKKLFLVTDSLYRRIAPLLQAL